MADGVRAYCPVCAYALTVPTSGASCPVCYTVLSVDGAGQVRKVVDGGARPAWVSPPPPVVVSTLRKAGRPQRPVRLSHTGTIAATLSQKQSKVEESCPRCAAKILLHPGASAACGSCGTYLLLDDLGVVVVREPVPTDLTEQKEAEESCPVCGQGVLWEEFACCFGCFSLLRADEAAHKFVLVRREAVKRAVPGFELLRSRGTRPQVLRVDKNGGSRPGDSSDLAAGDAFILCLHTHPPRTYAFVVDDEKEARIAASLPSLGHTPPPLRLLSTGLPPEQGGPRVRNVNALSPPLPDTPPPPPPCFPYAPCEGDPTRCCIDGPPPQPDNCCAPCALETEESTGIDVDYRRIPWIHSYRTPDGTLISYDMRQAVSLYGAVVIDDDRDSVEYALWAQQYPGQLDPALMFPPACDACETFLVRYAEWDRDGLGTIIRWTQTIDSLGQYVPLATDPIRFRNDLCNNLFDADENYTLGDE